MYGIYVHSIWVLGLPSGGGGEVRAYGRRGGFVVFGLLGHNLIGSVSLGLEPFGFGIPFIDGGGYGVHEVDMVHEYQVESCYSFSFFSFFFLWTYHFSLYIWI